VTAYAAPLVGGAAYVMAASTLAALRGAGHALADAPQPLALVVCVQEGHQDDEAATDGVVRSLFRRAAVAATLNAQAQVSPVGLDSRGVRRSLLAFGWLLLLGGGTIAAGIGGLWLALGYPLIRRATLRSADPLIIAAPLAQAIGASTIARRQHAGLTSLARLLETGGGVGQVTLTDRYQQAAAACVPLGLAPLAEFYGALARGAEPRMPWAAEERADGAVREPA